MIGMLAAQLFLYRYAVCARTGGFATNVYNIRSLLHHHMPRGINALVKSLMQTAMRKSCRGSRNEDTHE